MLKYTDNTGSCAAYVGPWSHVSVALSVVGAAQSGLGRPFPTRADVLVEDL